MMDSKADTLPQPSPTRGRTALAALSVNSPASWMPGGGKPPRGAAHGFLTSRTPLSLSRAPASSARKKPTAPSTPGSLDIFDMTDTEDDEAIASLGAVAAQSRIAQRAQSIYVPPSDRYSMGGTALGGYDRFSFSTLLDAEMRPRADSFSEASVLQKSDSERQEPSNNGIAEPGVHAAPPDGKLSPSIAAPPSQAVIPDIIPASTRALMLEERLRELEARNQSLMQQNSHLRRQQQKSAAAAAAAATSLDVGLSTSETSTQTSDRHPAFGRLVADLGHKRIYVASARTFVSSVPIWHKQRPCNEGRVDEIVRAKAKAPHLMGPIMCFDMDRDGGRSVHSHSDCSRHEGLSMMAMPSLTCPQPRAIFDGQHRARAAMRLLSSEDFAIIDDDESGDAPPESLMVIDSSVELLPATNGDEARQHSPQPHSSRGGSARLARKAAATGMTAVSGAAAGSGAAALTGAAPPTTLATAVAQPPSSRASVAPGGLYNDFELVLEVYPVSSEAEVKSLYLEVNKGEMVKEIDLPDQLAPDLKAHIDNAVAAVMARDGWRNMFKPSERCRAPHLHRDTLRNRLFQGRAARGIASADELVAMILRVNEQLKVRPSASWPERSRGKPLEKAKGHGCFLGLDDYAWIDLLCEQ